MVKLDLKLTCTISHGVLSQTIEPEPSSFIIGYGTIMFTLQVWLTFGASWRGGILFES